MSHDSIAHDKNHERSAQLIFAVSCKVTPVPATGLEHDIVDMLLFLFE